MTATDPQTLYRRWEESQWSPFTIDLAGDTVRTTLRELLPSVVAALTVGVPLASL